MFVISKSIGMGHSKLLPTDLLKSIVNITSTKGQLPLYTAIRRGNIENVKILLEAGARMDLFNRDTTTVLHGLAWDNRTKPSVFYNFLTKLSEINNQVALMLGKLLSYNTQKQNEETIQVVFEKGINPTMNGGKKSENK
jgi:ankyrin repeat protein